MVSQNLKILYTASTAGHLRSFHPPYLEALVHSGAEVTCAASGDGNGLPEGVSFIPVPFTKSFVSRQNFRAAKLLAAELRNHKYDIVLCHTSLAAFFTRLSVRRAGKGSSRVVNVVHGYLFDGSTPFFRRTLLLNAERLMAVVTDDILTMNSLDTQIANRYRLCRGRVEQIPGMGYDEARCHPASDEEKAVARRTLGIPADAEVLLCAAEFSKRKNQHFLIEALPRLAENTVLMLPGEGELRAECEALAAELGVADRVLFPGQVADMRPWRTAADVCVSAARSEGLPFHVMESMACSLPCVLSAVKGHEDLAFGAQLFPFGDADAFVSAITSGRRVCAPPERIAEYSLSRVLKNNLNLFLGGNTDE